MEQVLKNHVAILLDISGSMSHLTGGLTTIFNKQIQALREQSLSFNQETRVSVYTFNSSVKCLISDVDVARPMNIEKLYANGQTAILKCVDVAIGDLKELPTKYGDHAFILYILTDGAENASGHSYMQSVPNLIKSLDNNWTVAAFVPDMNGRMYMRNYGIPDGNIDKWDTTERGLEEAGEKFSQSMNSYFGSRKAGVRSSQTVFSDLKSVDQKTVKQMLDKIPKTKYNIVIHEGNSAIFIKEMVENKLGSYKQGNAYYELVKNEHVQASKSIAIQNKKTDEVFSGAQARKLLNLPDHEVKVCREDHGEWIVFIQSKSVNRNIIPKQKVLVMK